jgi:hypothetical protein
MKEGDRLLIEFETPTVIVDLDGRSYSKVLKEDDLTLLTLSKHKRWKAFLLMKHFKDDLKLTIPDTGHLTKIEEERKEEELISETDPREAYPIKEEEKKEIEATRVQLREWFPI